MRSASLVLLALFLAPAASLPWAELSKRPDYSFSEYVAEFGKNYKSEEIAMRTALFEKELAKIRAHNTDPAQTYKMGINQFSDWTEAEMASRKGLNRAMRFSQYQEARGAARSVDLNSLPKSVDWRDHKPAVMTPVKDQGGCGSCWAFASTETVESAVALATGKLYTLSPQQLVSCMPNPEHCGGTGGCQGATEPLAFGYVAQSGMTTEQSYPYEGRTGSCSYDKTSAVVGIANYTHLPTNDYASLMEAVATVGPVAISVDASWSGYESGVYSGSCGTTIDHAVQLVGYGTDEASGLDYWLIRNSWGPRWGESGYIRLKRFGAGKEPCGTDENPGDGNGCKGGPKTIQVCGECAVLSDSSYPTGGYVKK